MAVPTTGTGTGTGEAHPLAHSSADFITSTSVLVLRPRFHGAWGTLPALPVLVLRLGVGLGQTVNVGVS